MRALKIPYAALVPGASYRGLHDSLVNYLGNEDPTMLLCLHEEHAVAIAHGYAKVTGTPMLAIVHANVGLLHATMAIFNAWCDRVPILILGANGPVDAMKRRPWTDWVHTTQDLGAIVRDYTKWDDSPASAGAALEAVTRAYQIAATPPYGPTFVVLDAAWQEAALETPPEMPELARFAPPDPPVPSAADVARVADLLRRATKPVLLVGRVSRSERGWAERVALAEALGARVVTNLRAGAVFPTEHPLFAGHSAQAPALAALRAADVILDLDSIDLAGILRVAFERGRVSATVIGCSQDRYLHRGAITDYQALPPLDVSLAAGPDELVHELATAMRLPATPSAPPPRRATRAIPPGDVLSMDVFSAITGAAFAEIETCFIKFSRGLKHNDFPLRHPLDFLGADGGGGVGSGNGIAIGAALALRGRDRLPVMITGDGDVLMGINALWTAVANDIPLLIVVANNRSYYNDEVHQERIAKRRERPVERKWIGMRLDAPAPDIAAFARAQHAVGIGPITDPSALAAALREGIDHVRSGRVCVIDVHVVPPSDSAGQTGVSAERSA